MATAGYQSRIRRGGDVTSTVSEPFTSLGSDVYQITDSAKRVLDPNVTWSLSDGAGALDLGDVSAVDFLFGEVTIPGVSGTLRFTGSFIPLTTTSETIGEVFSHSLSEKSDLIDSTVYTGPGGSRMRKRVYGLCDASLTLDMNLNTTDMPSLATLHFQGSTVVVEVLAGAATPVFRAFGKIASISRNGEVAGKVEASIEWQLAAQRDPLTGFVAGYSERNPTL